MPGFSARPTACAASSKRRRSTATAAAPAQVAVDQQDRPCAARPRSGVRGVLARPRLGRDRRRPRPGGAAAVAVDVHLQAAGHRRRGALAPGRDLLHSRADQRDRLLVRARRRHRRQRLPVGGARRPSRPVARALRARRRCGACRDARRDAVARHPRGACRSKCRPARWCASTACCRTTARPTARRCRAMRTRCMPSTAAAAGRATTGCAARRRRAAFEPRRLRSSSGLPRLTARCRCLPNDGRATVPAWDLRFDHARHHGIHNGGLPCL